MTRFEELCDERHRTAQKLAHPPLSTTPYPGLRAGRAHGKGGLICPLCAQCLALTSPTLTHLQEAGRGPKKQRSKKGDPPLGEQVSNLKTEMAALNRAIDDGKTAVQEKLMALMSRLRTDGVPCLLYTSPSPRDKRQSRMPSSA